MSGNKKRFYCDACIYIAWLNQEDAYKCHLPSINIIAQENKERKNIIVTSVVTMMEIVKLAPEQERQFQECFHFGTHELYEVDVPVITKARQYELHYLGGGAPDGKSLLPVDAIHLATAHILAVDEFHTFDDGGKKGCSLLKLNGNVAGDPIKIRIPSVEQTTLFPPETRAIRFED